MHVLSQGEGENFRRHGIRSNWACSESFEPPAGIRLSSISDGMATPWERKARGLKKDRENFQNFSGALVYVVEHCLAECRAAMSPWSRLNPWGQSPVRARSRAMPPVVWDALPLEPGPNQLSGG